MCVRKIFILPGLQRFAVLFFSAFCLGMHSLPDEIADRIQAAKVEAKRTAEEIIEKQRQESEKRIAEENVRREEERGRREEEERRQREEETRQRLEYWQSVAAERRQKEEDKRRAAEDRRRAAEERARNQALEALERRPDCVDWVPFYVQNR